MLREAEIAGANARMRAEGVGAAVAAAKGAEEALPSPSSEGSLVEG